MHLELFKRNLPTCGHIDKACQIYTMSLQGEGNISCFMLWLNDLFIHSMMLIQHIKHLLMVPYLVVTSNHNQRYKVS